MGPRPAALVKALDAGLASEDLGRHLSRALGYHGREETNPTP